MHVLGVDLDKFCHLNTGLMPYNPSHLNVASLCRTLNTVFTKAVEILRDTYMIVMFCYEVSFVENNLINKSENGNSYWAYRETVSHKLYKKKRIL